MLLIESLQNPALYDHPIIEFEVIETHISWVLLTGDYVYKIKKPVNFGFLDFSTLEKRHFYCEEELRLNRQLAPDLYLSVVTIHGSEENPELNGHGPAIEYAVKMRQFPQSTQLDRLLTKQGIDNLVMDKLASKVAHFHLSIDSVKNTSDFGDLNHVRQPILENFEQIRACIDDSATVSQLEKLEHWSKQQLEELAELIQKRKAQGFVRKCHGDMHLRNIALWNNDITIFDCIEFNKNFYLIDVMSEIAFLIMDLEDRDQDTLAQRFLNSYLEITGDYEGLRLLQLYKVYRALVRAKVNALRLGQEQTGSKEYQQTLKDFMQYLKLAEKYIHPTVPCLLINHGLSGSGKSTITRILLEKFPAIQVRSDVERKRLFKVSENNKSTAAIEKGIYTTDATQQTYTRLLDIAQCLLSAGYSVVIDATNLKFQQRQPFIELAKLNHVPYFILTYKASEKTLRNRVIQRSQEGDDVSDATLNILQHQIETYAPLAEEEKPFTIEIDTDKNIDVEKIISHIHTGNIKF
ncbi:MAG: AAA family ATPase [Woeseiaceae bacterium]